jgi:hypothetical protein
LNDSCKTCGGSGSVETELYEGLVNCPECQQCLAVEHIPNWVDRVEPPEERKYYTTDDLLEADWVKSYAECDEFNNFCQSKDGRSLMIENQDGTWWWVVAHVTKDSLDLPVVRMVQNLD